jgi:transposase
METTPTDTHRPPKAGLTTHDIAKRYRVGEDRVRAWISRGELAAVNTRDPGGRPRWVVLPEALEKFERARSSAPPPQPVRRRRKQAGMVDFFPD